MNLRKLSNEVYLAPGPLAAINDAHIDWLRQAAAASPRGRVRINLHPDNDAPLHEMFIAIQPGSYIRPHKHPHKSESFHLVHGAVDVIVFDDAGEITDVIELGQPGSGKAFYYRMSAPLFHTLLIRSDLLVLHEVTNGPFDPGATVWGGFAPAEDAAAAAIQAWRQTLAERAGSRT